MAELWSDEVDYVVTSLDKQIKSDYAVSLKGLLSDPTQYVGDADIQMKISNIREEVNKFMGDQMKGLGDEVKRLEDLASKTNSITAQLSQGLTGFTKQYKVPVLKPNSIERESEKDTVIYVSSAQQDVTQFLERLVSTSDYIIDLSTKYKDYNVGSWLFAGKVMTVIRVQFGPTPALTMYQTREEIDSILGAASDLIKGIVGK